DHAALHQQCAEADTDADLARSDRALRVGADEAHAVQDDFWTQAAPTQVERVDVDRRAEHAARPALDIRAVRGYERNYQAERRRRQRDENDDRRGGPGRDACKPARLRRRRHARTSASSAAVSNNGRPTTPV